MKVQDERAIRKAARPLLPAREFQVLMALVEFTDPKRRCFPSTSTLAADLDVDKRTIKRALSALAGKGWIIREERRRADGGQTSSLITVLLPAEVVERQHEALLRLPLMRVISGGQACGEHGGQSVEKADPPVTNLSSPPGDKSVTPRTRPTSKDQSNSRGAHLAEAPTIIPGEVPPESPPDRTPHEAPAHGLREGEAERAAIRRKA